MDPQTTLQRARALRANQTSAEGRLWGELRGRKLGGWKWRRQAPIGSFIVDFFCPAARLVVELDGSHHLDQQAYDMRRTAFLEAQGLRVIRFPSEDVWGGGLHHMCHCILLACDAARNARL
jgi:very-short-patch-repair endonuclease